MKHHEQLDRYEEWFTTDLLQDDDGRCIGAICRNLRDGHLEVFNAKAHDSRLGRRRTGLQADDQRADRHR